MPGRTSQKKGGAMGYIKLMPSFIPLLLRSGISYIKLRTDAKRASKIFEKELIEGGIDPQVAKAIKNDYLETSKFFKSLMSNFSSSNFPGHGKT